MVNDQRLPEFADYVSSATLYGDRLDWLKTLLLFFDGVAINPWAISGEGFVPPSLEYRSIFHPFFDEGAFAPRTALTPADGRILDRASGNYYKPGGRPRTFDQWNIGLPYPQSETPDIDDEGVFDVTPRRLVSLEPVSHPNDPTWIRKEAERGVALRTLAGSSRPALSRFNLLSVDLQTVAYGLETVPLSEVMGFKTEHGAEFRAYRRNLNAFLAILYSQDAADQARLISDRREELLDMGDVLKRRSRLGFRLKRLTPFSLGVAGSALTGASGDFLGAAGGIIGAFSAINGTRTELGAYTYLASIGEKWKTR